MMVVVLRLRRVEYVPMHTHTTTTAAAAAAATTTTTTQGWVMSDWGATHSMSIIQGLDQEMPGDKYMSDEAIMQAVDNGTGA